MLVKKIQLDLFQVMLIPSSSEKLIKHRAGVLAYFLKPLFANMEEIFLNGIDVVYTYPIEDISEHTSRKFCVRINKKSVVAVVT